MTESETPATPDFLQRAITALTIALPSMFIAYCFVYLCACPTMALATAIGAELFALGISIVLIRSKVFALPEKLMRLIPERWRNGLMRVRTVLDYCKFVVLGITMTLTLIDFSALSFSAFISPEIGQEIYTDCPSSYWIGLHPAFTLEMLAGADVQSKEYSRAEPLYLEIMAIRTKISGANSDLASAIYADLGDFYIRKADIKSAERWYRRTIQIGPRTGRGYTALATLLREKGDFAESKEYYLKALTLREKIYGVNSRQYQDTLRGYKHLQDLCGSKSNLH